MNLMPPLFLSHGSPMTALEPRGAGTFMKRLGPAIAVNLSRQKAILVASAYSLTREPLLLATPRHSTVYYFGGFDPHAERVPAKRIDHSLTFCVLDIDAYTFGAKAAAIASVGSGRVLTRLAATKMPPLHFS